MKKVIIIGAGILGATTAYQLAKNGVQTILIDRNDSGQATGAASGIICPWLTKRRNKAWYELAKGGARIYHHLIEELKEDDEKETGYSQVGAIIIREQEEKRKELEQLAIKRRKDAPEIGEVSLLTPTQTKKLFPPLDDKYGAVHISGAGRVSGHLLRKALVNASEKHGALIMNGDAKLVHEAENIIGVQVNNHILEADYTVATSGAWMNELLKPVGISFQSYAQKGQVIQLEISNANPSTWPLLLPPSDQSIVPFDDHIIIGATHEDNVGFDYRLTAGGIHEVLTKALKFAPGLADSTIIGTKVGFRPFTPGFLPVFGEMPGYKGLLIANGLGASGLTTGPFIGRQLAKLVLGKTLDVNPDDYQIKNALS